MARRRGAKGSNEMLILLLLLVGVVSAAINAVVNFISDNKETLIVIGILIIVSGMIISATKYMINEYRKKLLGEIMKELHIEYIDLNTKGYDDSIIVKSRQTFDSYSDLKYLKNNTVFESVKNILEERKRIKNKLYVFLEKNNYEMRPQYGYVKNQLCDYMQTIDDYRVHITYITSGGNNKGERILHINSYRMDELSAYPEYTMKKSEYNKLLKQQAKEELDSKKHSLYDRVNSIIEFANESKVSLVVKSQEKVLDDLVQKLFDETVNSIQKISKIDSTEWWMIENFITTIDDQIREVVQADKRIGDFYESEAFVKIKETCNLITQSQKEFNEYISEKAESITQLFGTRIVRNETQNEDIYNYIRTYKKTITPFTAEVSSTVFGSAENNPIGYIIKYFYPDKTQYRVQIDKLRVLIEELETLKEAKVIIDNYKKEYNQYIQEVPEYILNNDEAGFYSRLGLAIIDESVLNIDYKFTYTSNGGMAQRSFTIPMNEENISELIIQLESRLTNYALAKEQRALMTSKLRTHIKERDNYTCCKCRNSVLAEPNLLLEIDHIIPISKGGLTQEDNLQTLCWKCNRNKGARLVF